MDMTAFPGSIFKSRIIFGNDFSSRFQIWGRNFKFSTFMVRKSWKTLLFRGLINCMRLLMDMTAFPGPVFKSRTIFGNNFSSRFQTYGQNFKFPAFGARKSWKTLLFRRLINCVWLLMDMTAFPGPIFKSRSIFGSDFSSRFQICGWNFKYPIFGTHKSW